MHFLTPNPAPSRDPRPPLSGMAALFPHVPTLLATRLQIELLLGDRPSSGSVDLREAAGILLNDLGATLEIFRLAGEQACCALVCGEGGCDRRAHDEGRGQTCGHAASVAARLEDCLASLGVDAWLEAVSADAVERTVALGGPGVLTRFWEHARSIAYSCWLLAGEHEEICPEEAYLAGLLHEAARLPDLLGWTPAQFGAAGTRWTPPALARLAAHFRLPAYLACLLTTSGNATRWKPLLEAAHACFIAGDLAPAPTA